MKWELQAVEREIVDAETERNKYEEMCWVENKISMIETANYISEAFKVALPAHIAQSFPSTKLLMLYDICMAKSYHSNQMRVIRENWIMNFSKLPQLVELWWNYGGVLMGLIVELGQLFVAQG